MHAGGGVYWFDVVIHYGSNRTVVLDERYFTRDFAFDRVGYSFEHVDVDVAIIGKSNEDEYVSVDMIVVLIYELMIGSSMRSFRHVTVDETVDAFEVTDFNVLIGIFFLEVFHRE